MERESNDEQEPNSLWTHLVINSARLYPEELKQHIDQAFSDDLIDLFFVNDKDIDYYLQIGKDATLSQLQDNSHYFLIEDTISEMESWACFQDEKCKKTTHKPLGGGTLNLFSEKKSNQSKKKRREKCRNNRVEKIAPRKNNTYFLQNFTSCSIIHVSPLYHG